MKEDNGQQDKARVKRRDFLKQAGLIAGTAGVAAVVGKPKAAAAADADAKGLGYRETEHVRTYYELAKF